MSETSNIQNEHLISRRGLLAGGLGVAATLALRTKRSEAQQTTTNTKLAPIISRVNTKRKVVAFSFDDGPWPINTQLIMNHFDNFGLEGEATFFETGGNIKLYRRIAQEVAFRGFEIGNHSMTHSYKPATIASEIAPTQELIHSIGGHSNLFRSPGLTRGTIIQQRLAILGMVNVFTDSDIGDWRAPRISSDTIAQRTVRAIKPGSIVLLHDGGSHRNTANAIPYILEAVLNEGYDVVRVSELLAMGAPR